MQEIRPAVLEKSGVQKEKMSMPMEFLACSAFHGFRVINKPSHFALECSLSNGTLLTKSSVEDIEIVRLEMVKTKIENSHSR